MPTQILADLMARAGEDVPLNGVTFRGEDPVFPTPYRIGDLGAAAIASAAVEATTIYEDRTGRAQDVDVEVDAAAIAMRSSRYIRDDPARESAAPAMRTVGFYPTRDDRWIFMQRLFPHHFERQLSVLDCGPTDDAIARASRRWNGQDLEDAIIGAGACGALVRTRDEWSGHPQGQSLHDTPLFSITRIGDSETVPAGSGDRPLGGVRVLDVTRVLAGPMCARTLAEHGADVLRISSAAYPDNPRMMRDTGHGKRSCRLDLKSASDAAVLRHLVGGADVFAQGYRPGAMARLGFAPEELARIRPGLIYVSISAYGNRGPWADRRGFDSVVQSASGISADLADGSGMPKSLPANPLDYTTGYLAAFLVLVALRRRAREGGSYHVELSLAQTGHYLKTLSRADPGAVSKRAADLPATRIEELMISRDTPFGRLRYFAPVARLSVTPPAWDLPTVPANHDSASWL